VRLSLGPHDGLSLWLDGKPTPLAAENIDLDFPTGRHTITLAVNQLKRTAPLEVELLPIERSEATARLVLDREHVQNEK
jgi:hypothetical protein